MDRFSVFEQKQFLCFLKDLRREKVNDIIRFLESDKNDKLKDLKIKAFLSLEIDKNNGGKIIQIARDLEQTDTEKVLGKITELTGLAQEKNQELSQKIYNDDIKKIPVDIRLELLKKAHEIINQFSETLDKESIEKLLKDLEQNKIEINLLSAVLKSAKEQGEKIDFETIKNFNISTLNYGESFSGDDKNRKDEIRQLVIDCRKKPDETDEDIKKTDGYRNLDIALDDEKYKKYMLEYSDSVIGFIYFKENYSQENNEKYLYAGGLNIHKEIKGFNVGSSFMDATLKKEAENNIIKGLVLPGQDVNCHYVEKVDFVIDGITFESADKLPRLTITINNEKNKNYKYKNINIDSAFMEDKIKKQGDKKLEDLVEE